MLNGEQVKKAIELFGKDVVEEVITAVNFENGDAKKVKNICQDLNNLDGADCVEYLYPSPPKLEDIRNFYSRKRALI